MEKSKVDIIKLIVDIEYIVRDFYDFLGWGESLFRLMLRCCVIYFGRIYRVYFDDLECGIVVFEKFVDFLDV